jgi:hypothetical protein
MLKLAVTSILAVSAVVFVPSPSTVSTAVKRAVATLFDPFLPWASLPLLASSSRKQSRAA